jgi:hypothetical protein
MTTHDHRAKLRAKPGGSSHVFGENTPGNILKPLIDQGGLVFPYTPTVLFSGSAEYDVQGFTHGIYNSPSYIKGGASDIQVTCDFTSQTDAEASHTLATMHFLRSVSKAYFGAQQGSANAKARAGTPPPILLFSYLGDFMFNDVPVVVTTFSWSLGPEVDYVPVRSRDINGNVTDALTKVPAQVTITVTLTPSYNTKHVRDNFDLDKFRSGSYVGSGSKGRTGGFI